MHDQLYVYDCLTGKLRVSNGDLMAIGAGKQNTFRVKTRSESAGVFAQRNGVCCFFPHNKLKSYSINSNRVTEATKIKPERFYLFIVNGGCFIVWFGNDDSRPDFGNFDSNSWFIYHPGKQEWSGSIELKHLVQTCRDYDETALATFEGLGHDAFLLSDLREVADFFEELTSKESTAQPAAQLSKTGYCCPSCQEKFIPNKALAIATHPALMGDPILGAEEMKRFEPTQYTPRRQVLDELGSICTEYACPFCHHKLPPFFEQTQHHHIAIVGAPGVGKTYFQAAQIHQLERELPRDFGIQYRDADPESNAAISNMRIRVFYSTTAEEFREGRAFMRGNLRKQVWRNNAYELFPRPFIYTLNKEKDSHSLVYYNTGNYKKATQQAVAIFEKNKLRETDSIFYLFDPTLEPAFREVLAEQKNPPSSMLVHQSQQLADIETQLRATLHLPPGERLHTPLAIILTKSDLWKHLLGPESLLPAVRNGRFKPENIKRNSARIRDLLFKIVPEVCTNAEAISDKVCYFAVSSFGSQPESYIDDFTGEEYISPIGGKLAPVHVTDPALWMLYSADNNLLPEA